jgi:excisionase family DNA binding protein
VKLLCTKEIAALLGVHPRTAIRMFKSGEIQAFRSGPRLWRTTSEICDQYVKRKLAAEAELRGRKLAA